MAVSVTSGAVPLVPNAILAIGLLVVSPAKSLVAWFLAPFTIRLWSSYSSTTFPFFLTTILKIPFIGNLSTSFCILMPPISYIASSTPLFRVMLLSLLYCPPRKNHQRFLDSKESVTDHLSDTADSSKCINAGSVIPLLER